MSMIGEYLRLSPEDLKAAVADHEEMYEALEGLWDAEDPRLFDTDKAWHALAFVLNHAGVSEAVIYGDDQVPGAGDWGYGPPSNYARTGA